jgi:hypothetical protein
MSLLDAVAEALANAQPPPPNEAATCLWVIYPLLLAAGYSPLEVQPQGPDSSGQYPDYTLLPQSPHRWYLEAKAWSAPLKHQDAQQAVTYANSNGKRWVVLSNGREWRLYDNLVQDVVAHKLVHTVRLDDAEAAERFLTAISKVSVCTGGLERYATHVRLYGFLQRQLSDQDSSVNRAVWGLVRKEQGLSGVSRGDVLSALRDAAKGTLVPAVTTVAPPPQSPSTPSATDDAPEAAPASLSLDVLAGSPSIHTTGKKPTAVTFPDGTAKPLTSWRDLAVEVVTWLDAQPGVKQISGA